MAKAKRPEEGTEHIQEDLLPLAIDIDSPVLDLRNARIHPDENIEQIKQSFLVYGQCKPVVVNKHSGVIEAGNGMVIAARQLGWKRIAVTRADHDPSQATGYGIMDNKSSLSSEWDMPMLKDLFEELDTGSFNMDWTGFDKMEIEDLMTQVHVPEEGLIDDDAVPEATESISRRGDLWTLGSHRLLCGDATVITDVERLMDGQKADMVFTDPPYGIGIVKGIRTATIGGSKPFGRVRQPGGRPSGVVGGKGVVEPRLYRPIIGDDEPFDPSLLLTLSPMAVLFGANHYASRLPDTSGWLVWDKGVSPDATFSACELIWTNVGNHIKRYEHRWSGMVRKGARDEELADRVHPTQKPVGLCVQILEDFKEEQILDPYGGSGSTLIACEKLGRRCYMMEIDEHYCDVIIKRWEDFTGKQAVRVG